VRARSLGTPVVVRLTSINWPRLVATFLLTVTVLSIVVSIVVWGGQRFRPPPVSFIQGHTVFVAEMFYAISYAAMGWLLATRLVRNPLGWIFLALGVTMALQLTVTFFVEEGHQALRPLSYPLLVAAWLGSSVHLPSVVFFTATVFLRFPTGRPVTPRWYVFGILTLAGAILIVLGIGLLSEGLAWYPSLPNVFAAPIAYQPALGILTVAGLVLVLVGVLGSAASMVVRYHRSLSVERAQLRWIAAAVIVLTAGGLPFIVARYGLQMDYASGEILLSIALVAGCFLPIAAAIAVLRHRLYDIDLILKRAFVYLPLTGILGGVYAAGVALFQKLFQAITGDRSDAAIVITTLVLASMFTPVKNSLQTFVDRRFKPEAEKPAGLSEDYTLTLEQRVVILEGRLSRMEVGADPRSYDED
jgi:hypothetical protein